MRRAALGIGIALLLIASVPVGAERLRVATYNVEGLGDPDAALGTDERESWDALVAVLVRGDAEVWLLQEVAGPGDVALIPRLALESGYAHQAVSDTSGTLSGGLRTACLSRHPLPPAWQRSWSAAALSEANGGVAMPAANDIGRDLFAAVLDVEAERPWILFSLHLKSGFGQANQFRRQVELLRLRQAIELELSAHPSASVVVVGDFNEDPGDAASGLSWDASPGGLPASFQLGSDILFPVTHDPWETMSAAGLSLLDATHEDRPDRVLTRPASGRRLDLIWLDARSAACGTEVYESCEDDGLDAPPWGHWLPKRGETLSCGTSERAADHLPVLADLRRLPDLQRPEAIGPALRVRDHGPADAAFISAELDWSGDAGLPRPPRDHYHLLRGTEPDALVIASTEGLQLTTWTDETERASSLPSAHFYVLQAVDACEVGEP